MKKLLVSQRIIIDKKNKSLRDCLDHQLINFLIKNGYFVIPVPNLFVSKRQENRFLNLYFQKSKFRALSFPEVMILENSN